MKQTKFLPYSKIVKKVLPDDWRSYSGNVHRISDTVLTYVEYNFLPGTGWYNDVKISLDGHYTFFVNLANFDWRIYKSSDYGSLTWVTKVDFTGLMKPSDFPKDERKILEHFIACKVLSTYFYDRNHVNSRGANIIPAPNEDDDHKNNLLVDNRGYIWCDSKPEELSLPEQIALHEMIGYEPKEYEVEVKWKDRKCLDLEYVDHPYIRDKEYHIPVKVNGVDAEIIHYINFAKQYRNALMYKKKLYCENSTGTGFKDYVKCLPTAMKHYANFPI